MTLTETEDREYKRQISNTMEQSIVAFLNSGGGKLYMGIDDDGSIYGIADIDDVVLKFSSKIKTNISPSAIGLYSIEIKEEGGKKYFIATIAGGSDKPYFLTAYGRTPKGCYIRTGAQNSQMTQNLIDEMYVRRMPTSLQNVVSPRQTLTFRQLKIYYEAMGYTTGNDSFLQNLDLFTSDGKYNYLAYLLADENGISIKVVRFAGSNPSPIEKDEYGRGCILKAAYSVLDRLKFYNRTAIEFVYPRRVETKLIDPDALREAALNAIIHNDYINGAYPIFSVYDDRIEILSTGGLPGDLTEEEFFKGRSKPRYRELIRIFSDLDLGEQLGSGMKKILSAYSPQDYEISKNFVIAELKYNSHALDVLNRGNQEKNSMPNGGENGIESGIESGIEQNTAYILSAIAKNNKVTQKQISLETGIPVRTVAREIKRLQELGRLMRRGGDYGGYWEILK
jgi:predicted HTH transcriptional regulator